MEYAYACIYEAFAYIPYFVSLVVNQDIYQSMLIKENTVCVLEQYDLKVLKTKNLNAY